MKVTRQTLVAVGALAAIVGGACWAVKAAGILITGVQPPVIYDVAPLFFPVTVLGLYSLLDAPRSGSARSGLVLACCAELAALILVVGLLVGPPEWSPNGNTVTVLTPFTAVASLATLVGLCLLGVVVRRTRALTGWWATLPVLLSFPPFLLLAVGAPRSPSRSACSKPQLWCSALAGSPWVPDGATSHRDQWSEWIVGLKPGTAAWSGVPRAAAGRSARYRCCPSPLDDCPRERRARERGGRRPAPAGPAWSVAWASTPHLRPDRRTSGGACSAP